MKLSINTKHPNYAAKIVQIGNLEKHPNADRLQLAVIDFQLIVTGLETKEGDLFVHFPAECKINADFLKFENAFRKKELNSDPEALPGFFEEKCRVKSIKLRGIVSEGYLHPVHRLNAWLVSLGATEQITKSNLGDEFDTISAKGLDNDIFFTKKYFIKKKRSDGTQKQEDGKSRLVDGQFHLHCETAQIKRNMNKINPDDFISISAKLHGSNAVFANILVKRKLSLVEKIAKFFGAKVVESEYDYVWSSRRVIKNKNLNQELSADDVWNVAALNLKNKVAPGISLYCEIVGYHPSGKMVQKDFDYGCEEKEHAVYVFRITHTDSFGVVREFSTQQIEDYCKKYMLNICPVFFKGRAVDFCGISPHNINEKIEEDLLRDWREKFLNQAIEKYTEKDCFMCCNTVPEEGVVIRKEGEYFEAFKLKSLRFLEKETIDLDSGNSEEEEG